MLYFLYSKMPYILGYYLITFPRAKTLSYEMHALL